VSANNSGRMRAAVKKVNVLLGLRGAGFNYGNRILRYQYYGTVVLPVSGTSATVVMWNTVRNC